MKKWILGLMLLFIGIIPINAQLISPASMYQDGLALGIEKNKSLFVEYGYKRFNARLKQTIIIDKPQYQSLRIEGGYTLDAFYFDLTCDLFYSTDWYICDYNFGTQISLVSKVFDKYGNLGFSYIPYYDSEQKGNNGWSVSGKVNVAKDISLVAEYGNVPDFRIAYNRLYLGAIFTVKNLFVYPVLEIPLYENETHLSHSKMVVSMCYTFVSNK